MPAIVLEIPAEVVSFRRLPEGRAPQELRREFTVFLVKEGLRSQPQACQVAELARLDFEDLLAQRQVSWYPDPGEVLMDIAAAEASYPAPR